MRNVIGLDLGTTTIKATLFDETGKVLAEKGVERSMIFPRPDFYDQDAQAWYVDSCDMIRAIVAKAGVAKESVAGISISSQGITIVPTDENFMPLRNAINWLDTRAVDQMDELSQKVGAELITATTGRPTHSSFALPKIMWFRDNEPEIFDAARWFLMPMDFITAKFTGNAVTDHSMAAGSLGYSLHEKGWWKKQLDAAGISEKRLPEIRWAGESAGHLTKRAAEDCGLTTDCIMAVGGQDQKVAAYGARLEHGVVTYSMGTCGAFEFLLDTPTLHPDRKLSTCPHVMENSWVMEGCIDVVGGAIKWVRDNICPDLSYKDMDAAAQGVPAGSDGVLCYPYFTGMGSPHTQQSNTLARFENIALGCGRPQLIRALYEAIAYETRLNIEAGEELSGRVSSINAFSGASRGGILCQIIADVTGCTMRSYNCAEMGNMGAARLAATACGLDADSFGRETLLDCVDRVPGKDSAKYDGLYHDYVRGCVR